MNSIKRERYNIDEACTRVPSPHERWRRPVRSIAIVAEKDLVIISFAVKKQEPAKPGFYTTTAFDMFRIENGLIAEHWDPSEMWVDGKPPGAEFFSEWDH